MRQILQNLRTGAIAIAEVPCPKATQGSILIQTRTTLISAGTERMLVEFSQANLLRKARLQPEKVRQALDKIRTDGLLPTLEAVFRKLDQPLPLGYCNVGVAVETGPGVADLRPGDRVVSNGPHAEIVCVPRNLCAKIPEGVSDEQAAFTVLGGIALQGLRLAQPTFGERFMVIGAGLLGLLTVQLLRASGCEALAVDPRADRLALAESFGARTVSAGNGADPIAAAGAWTGGRGVDGVLITASSPSSDLVHQAAQACRKRGRIVLVGVVGLELKRSDFYEKELTFQVSCSYGPGRYDENYEQAGQDYPLGFVRWTEQRNFEAVLGALRTGTLRVDALITDRHPLGEAATAYEKIQNGSGALGVLLEYPARVDTAPAVRVRQAAAPANGRRVTVGLIGAGDFANAVLLPALARSGAQLACVADVRPAAAWHAARKFGAERAVTDYEEILADPDVRAVFVAVGHHLHARLLCEALEAGKHVFVEKPLALSEPELAAVAEAVTRRPDRIVMVGFNRRFSAHTRTIQRLLAGRSEPLSMAMTVNAGFLAPDHWTQDPERGGGRIIGEGCHFIDLLACVASSPAIRVAAARMGGGTVVRDDKMIITVEFADGSIGALNYFANGSKGYPKETLEIFSDGRVLRLENFRVTHGYGFRGFRKYRTFRQDKGHNAEIAAFVERVAAGGEPLIPFEQLHNVTLATFAAVESAGTGRRIMLGNGCQVSLALPDPGLHGWAEPDEMLCQNVL